MKHLKAVTLCHLQEWLRGALKRTLASLAPLPLSPLQLGSCPLLSTTFYSKKPVLARSWSKLLESSPGVVCPDGSTLTLLHCGDRQTAHKQVSIIVPLHCQECIYGCDLPGAEEMLSEGTHEGNCSGCHNVLQGQAAHQPRVGEALEVQLDITPRLCWVNAWISAEFFPFSGFSAISFFVQNTSKFSLFCPNILPLRVFHFLAIQWNGFPYMGPTCAHSLRN